MCRPHVYERTSPRSRNTVAPPAARSVEVATFISRALPALINAARGEGLDALADALEIARRQAEVAAGRGGVIEVE